MEKWELIHYEIKFIHYMSKRLLKLVVPIRIQIEKITIVS